MRVCCKYHSDLTLHAQVRSKGMVKVLQFKATVWPKVASESTYEAQKFQGSISQTPLVASAFHTASSLKLGWAWVRGYSQTYSVPTLCPGIGCVLTTPLQAGNRWTDRQLGNRWTDRQLGNRWTDRQATDRQVGKQRDRWATDRQAGKQTDRWATDRQAGKQMDRQTDRWATDGQASNRQTGEQQRDRRANRQTGGQTDRQAGKQRDKGWILPMCSQYLLFHYSAMSPQNKNEIFMNTNNHNDVM